MSETPLKVHYGDMLQSLSYDNVEKTDLGLFEKSHKKTLTSTYSDLQQTVEQAVAKEIYLGGADDIFSRKIGKSAYSQEFMSYVIYQHV